MRTRTFAAVVAAVLSAVASTVSAQTQPVTIRATSAFDGRGRSRPDVSVVVQNGKIVSVASGRGGAATYDLRGLTLLPGLIDTHVHIDTHFGKDGRAATPGETPQQSMLYSVENAWITLMAGFTTVQRRLLSGGITQLITATRE